MKHSDIADTTVFIRDVKDPQNVVFQETLPYLKRTLEIDTTGRLGKKLKVATDYQICLIAKDSNNFARKLYGEQCKDLRETISGTNKFLQSFTLLFSVLLLHLFI